MPRSRAVPKPRPAPDSEPIKRMAAAIRRIKQERGACLTADLLRLGFSNADIKVHGDRARELAAQGGVR